MSEKQCCLQGSLALWESNPSEVRAKRYQGYSLKTPYNTLKVIGAVMICDGADSYPGFYRARQSAIYYFLQIIWNK